MRSLGVHSVYVLDDQDPFEIPLAQIVAGDAARAGIAVAGHDSLDVTGATRARSSRARSKRSPRAAPRRCSSPGGGGAGAVALWRQLHAADPHLLLLGSSAMVSEPFASQLGAAAASTYLTTPVLAREPLPAGPAPRARATTAAPSAAKRAPTRSTATRR